MSKLSNEDILKSVKDTQKHIDKVKYYIKKMIIDLGNRAETHDKSKMEHPELAIFAEYGPKLKNVTYGSDKYFQYLKEMQVALDYHYGENRHHPEHFEDGVKDMTLIDLIEMVADWKAASERHNNGDIYKSIEFNQERFNYSDDLKIIFKNTVREYLK